MISQTERPCVASSCTQHLGLTKQIFPNTRLFTQQGVEEQQNHSSDYPEIPGWSRSFNSHAPTTYASRNWMRLLGHTFKRLQVQLFGQVYPSRRCRHHISTADRLRPCRLPCWTLGYARHCHLTLARCCYTHCLQSSRYVHTNGVHLPT